jgi:hypothetical protein
MKYALLRLMLLSSAVFLNASSLLAESPRITPPATLAAWIDTVNARIARTLSASPDADGTATARFRLSAGGAPEDIRVTAPTPALDRALRTEFAHLRDLPPLPPGVDPRNPIEMRVMIYGGDDDAVYAARRQAMLNSAARENSQLAARLAGGPVVRPATP